MLCFFAKADRRSWGSTVSGKRIRYKYNDDSDTVETRPGGGNDDDDDDDVVGDRRTGADPDDFQVGSIPKAGDIGHSVLERTYFSGTGGTAQRGKLRGGQP
jgi:hypothetical protein